MSSSLIPGPVSATSTTTQAPSSKARTSMVSPAAENLKALSSRLWHARKSRSRSPETGGSGQGACGQRQATGGACRLRPRPGDLQQLAQQLAQVHRLGLERLRLQVGQLAQVAAEPGQPVHLACAGWPAPASSTVSSRLARAARMAVSGFLISWSRRRMKRRCTSACSPLAARARLRPRAAWPSACERQDRRRRRPPIGRPRQEDQRAEVGPQVEDRVRHAAGLRGRQASARPAASGSAAAARARRAFSPAGLHARPRKR